MSCIFVRSILLEMKKKLISRCATQIHEQLARHKWPERIVLCVDFPRTASGKIQKHLLKDKGILHA